LLIAATLTAAAVAAACGSAGGATASISVPATTPGPASSLAATPAAPRASNPPALGLRKLPWTFSRPVYLTSPPGNTKVMVVVEKGGTVRVIRNGHLLPRSLLNLSGRVSTGGEQGLLSLAFDPRYSTNRFIYVYYTDTTGFIRVVRYRVTANGNAAIPSSARVLLSISHPISNHNGGQLQFGPDGLLYLGVGDGGGGGDPNNNGQNRRSRLGKLLRLNVRAAHPNHTLYAYGLRNPWRFSFDRLTGDLWIGDVGQDKWEEIDYLKRGTSPGTNFGWSYYEGNHVFKTQPIDRSRLVFPVFEYSHALGDAVVGGYVYRGSAIPSLRGWYVFADDGSGRVWATNGPTGVTRQVDLGQNVAPISSFGENAAGTLYVISLNGGIYRIIAP
jgi:glucose/arabinose dehydrogenase